MTDMAAFRPVVAAAVVVALTACAAPAVRVAEPLPAHPGIVAGALPNGVQYRIRTHASPPGRVSLRLHLRVGSYNEADDERGYAHFLEHLAFAGSANFPAGEAVPSFESRGLTFGLHQNAYTSVDQTVYMLELPGADDGTLRAGLTFLADVLGRLELREDRVAQERAVVLAERRRGLGPGQRLMEQWFPRLLQGSLAAERLPIGTEETIRAAERDALLAFYRRWYTTGNATVVLVGDVAADRARELIAGTFGVLPAAAATEPAEPGAVDHDEPFAVVATDPEATGAQVGLLCIRPRRSPAGTVAEMRIELVESLAAFAFNRRLSERVAAGEVSFRNGGASIGDFFRVGWLAAASASGDAADWRPMLAELAGEVRRAVALGFHDREIDDARQAMIASARQFARAEPTVPAAALAGMILDGVQDRTPVPSGGQRLALLERLLPGITADEASAAFRESFAPDRIVATVYMVDGEHVPDEGDVLPVVAAAFGADVSVRAERRRRARFLDALPEPGSVAEHAVDEDTGVYSAWLDNGVRVHHRYMDYRENDVGVRITLAGGTIEESAATRGLTAAAVETLRRLATRTLSSTDVRDLLVGRTVRVGIGGGADAMNVALGATPDQLEHGLQLVHLLLTEPLLEPVAFGQWQRATLQRIEAARTHTGAQLGEIVERLRFPPGDPRWQPLTADEVERLDLESAQRWLDAFVRRAPVEVAIVGDIGRDAAMELATRYLGSLPERGRIGPALFGPLRDVPPPPAVRHAATIESATPQAAVMVGFAGADEAALDDVRALSQAARILSTRMVRRIREDEGLVYGIGARHRAGVVLPGYGLFSSGAAVAPEDAARLADLVEEMFAEFSASGPTADEVAVALRQFENEFGEAAQEPGYWLGRLAVNAYRGDEPVSPARTFAAYRALDAARIHDAFRRYHDAGRSLRISVAPAVP